MQSPGSLGTASGTLTAEGDNQAATYQLLALHRYWVATRDDAFVSEVWPTCSGALAHMIKSFDPNATGVLGAPNHLNAFLYLPNSNPQLTNCNLLVVNFSEAVRMPDRFSNFGD